MNETKIKEIEYWISTEIKINNGTISQDYLLKKSIRRGFTSNQVLEVIGFALWQGRYYEPYSGIIAKVPYPYIGKKGRTLS